jgi:probable rRNA maturation factor
MAEERNNNFSITNKTKGKVPPLPFVDIKNSVLGKKYSLSLVIAGDTLSRKLNKTYRNKDKPTNVLSFSLGDTEGEIFLNLKKAKAEAPQFSEKYKNFVGYLFIHGLLHLKGMDHGSTMENTERKIRRKFNI